MKSYRIMTTEPQSEQIFFRSPDVFSTEAGGELALMSIANGCYYTLNPVASDIWRSLERPMPTERLAAMLADEYDGDPVRIESDLRDTLDEWHAWRLITAKPQEPR